MESAVDEYQERMSMRVQLGRLLRRLRSRGMRGSAMNARPSLRHGLPYGWWKSGEFWETFAAIMIWTLTIVGITGLVLAWWMDWKAWW